MLKRIAVNGRKIETPTHQQRQIGTNDPCAVTKKAPPGNAQPRSYLKSGKGEWERWGAGWGPAKEPASQCNYAHLFSKLPFSQRAENGGLDPSWLIFAFLGRPDFPSRGPKTHWEIKGWFHKRVVLANVPSFRFSFGGKI